MSNDAPSGRAAGGAVATPDAGVPAGAPYADTMAAHLGRYKRERLGVLEDGRWRGNDRLYPHVLPEALHRLNVVETVRREFWTYHAAHAATIALHTDFHHLNSSQAFAFNLFFPWVGLGADPAPLLAALGVPGLRPTAWAFEHVPEPGEGTTFDVSDACARLLVEVKLTERQFGACAATDAYRRRRAEYLPRLAGLAASDALDEAGFFAHYQLLRNVSHLAPARGDALVLLVPRGNPGPWAQAAAFRAERLTGAGRKVVHLVAVEDVLDAVAKVAGAWPPAYRSHGALLREKYLPT